MDLKHKKVLVVGGGKSGIAAVGLLTKMGAESILFDSKKGITAEELRESCRKDTKRSATEKPYLRMWRKKWRLWF